MFNLLISGEGLWPTLLTSTLFRVIPSYVVLCDFVIVSYGFRYILIYSERLIAFLSFRFSFPLPFCSTLTNAPLAEDEDTAEDASGSHRSRPHGIVIDGLECRLALLGHLLYLLY